MPLVWLAWLVQLLASNNDLSESSLRRMEQFRMHSSDIAAHTKGERETQTKLGAATL